MTFGQLYNNAIELADKSGNPYISPQNFDIYANIKYNDWVEMMGKAIEQDERLMADIMFLYKVYQKPNSTFIDRVVDIPDFRRRLRFYSHYKDCNNKDKYPNIRVALNATVDEMQNDPNQKGIDADPSSVTTIVPGGNVGWLVFSDNTPLDLNLTYLKTPQVIDSENNPNTVYEAYNYVANYIIRAVVYNIDITIENYNRSKMEQQDLAQVLQ